MNYAGNVITVVLFASLLFCLCKKKFAGPYDIVFKGMYYCDDLGENIFRYSTKLMKLNRTHNLYNSSVSIPRGISDSMSVKVDFSVFGNGGWKDNFIHIELRKACSDTVKTLPGVFESLVEATGVHFNGCPFPPGDYEVRNWVFRLNFAMPVFPYGLYKMRVAFLEQQKILTCFFMEVDVIPKQSKNV